MSIKEKKYVTETWKSFKYITHPKTGKVRKQKLKFRKGIRFGLDGITPDYDKEDILKEAFTNIFRNARDLEPKAPEMEIDWMKEQQTIHIVYIYPDRNVQYFFKWWMNADEVPSDDEQCAKEIYNDDYKEYDEYDNNGEENQD